MTNEHVFNISIRDIQIQTKTKMGYHYIPIIMAKTITKT